MHPDEARVPKYQGYQEQVRQAGDQHHILQGPIGQNQPVNQQSEKREDGNGQKITGVHCADKVPRFALELMATQGTALAHRHETGEGLTF